MRELASLARTDQAALQGQDDDSEEPAEQVQQQQVQQQQQQVVAVQVGHKRKARDEGVDDDSDGGVLAVPTPPSLSRASSGSSLAAVAAVAAGLAETRPQRHQVRRAYSLDDVAHCVERIVPLSYNETVRLEAVVPVPISITPHSSGYALGAANWTIRLPHGQRVVVVGASRTASPLQVYAGGVPEAAPSAPAASSSSSSPAPSTKIPPVYKPLDTASIRKADAVLLHDWEPLAEPMTVTPSASGMPLAVIASNVEAAVRDKGNVLIPCSPAGAVLELIEAISHRLFKNLCNKPQNKSRFGSAAPSSSYASTHGLPRLIVVSPQATQSLVYAGVSSEWLHPDRQARAYRSQSPFSFRELRAKGLLVTADSLESPAFHAAFTSRARGPCVVLAAHASLRCGPALDLFRSWAPDARNRMLLVSSEFRADADEALLELKASGARMRIVDCRRRFEGKLCASDLVSILESSERAPRIFASGEAVATDLSVEKFVAELDVASFALNGPVDFVPARVDPALAAALQMKQLGGVPSQVSATRVRARLRHRDGQYSLHAVDSPAKAEDANARPQLVWGDVELADLLSRLQHAGINDAKLTPLNPSHRIVTSACIADGGLRIEVPSLQVSVLLSPERTVVKGSDPDAQRLVLRLVLQELRVL